MNGGNLTLGSAASVSCDISYPMRGSVIMVLISDTGFDVMATFDMDTADGSKDTTTKNGLTLSRSQEGQVTTLTLTFRAFACSQAGVYVCSDDGGHTGSATVKAVGVYIRWFIKHLQMQKYIRVNATLPKIHTGQVTEVNKLLQ